MGETASRTAGGGAVEADDNTNPESLARRLYDTHGHALASWTRRRFADGQMAEEVVQETVLAAWRKYDQFDPERGSERAWIFGIARNAAASRHRRSLRHLRSVPSDAALDQQADDEELQRVVERSLIVDALQALTSDHRDVIVVCYWEGLSTRQASQRLGIPEGTVKSRLHYALRSLRTHLEEREVLR